MEKCIQCKVEAEQHPVVVIMNVKDVVSLEDSNGNKADVIGLDPGGTWAAAPVCNSCHHAPRLKGHFFMRGDEGLALRLANYHSVRMPQTRK